MNLRKYLSILLAVALLAGVFTVPALAEEPAPEPVEESAPEVVEEKEPEPEPEPERNEDSVEGGSGSEEEQPPQEEPQAPAEAPSNDDVIGESPAEGEPEAPQAPAEEPPAAPAEEPQAPSEPEEPAAEPETPAEPVQEPVVSEPEPVEEPSTPTEPPVVEEVTPPVVEETQPEPVALPDTQPASIHLSATADPVPVGSQGGFRYSISHATRVEYWLTAPNGSTAASGSGRSGEGTFTFEAKMAGHYTISVLAISEDGSEVSASASLNAVESSLPTVKVSCGRTCCHGGDPVSFSISVGSGVQVASCSISAYQSGSEFYHSSTFTDSVSVTPPVKKSPSKVTLSVSITDACGRTAEDSVTIPCAVHQRESREQWEATMANVKLTGAWPQDVIAIAQSQVGYQESTVDFGMKDNGGISGYTRYGDWAGMPYEEWCAMFACFCLHYAGISEEVIPHASNCQRWIKKLSPLGLYAERREYDPKPGDLAFFDWEGDNDSDHVGIIVEVRRNSDGTASEIRTIEGNSTGGAVTSDDVYAASDGRIVGYGLVNLAYEQSQEVKPTAATAAYDGCTINADFPEAANITGRARIKAREAKRGTASNAALTGALTAALGGEPAYARFLQMRVVDGSGASATPEAPVALTIRFDEAVEGGKKLKPGIAWIDGGEVDISRDVKLERGKDDCAFIFETDRFDGVIAFFVD